jgi:hypothetical protein
VHVATMVRTGVVTLRASGPLGVLIVHLKWRRGSNDFR